MMFKHSILYSVLFTGISVSALAKTELQTDAGIDSEIVLDQVNVITELEKAKAAGEKQKEIVNLSLLGHQTAFTAPISVVNYDEKHLKINHRAMSLMLFLKSILQ
ncbi:Uncharacterised protein [Rodentibacter pneumotropicus]|uniref:Uncharacterized protein n=1 Tax=Rodentibacter pneumotropicus TaxID=758 RepID=A0A448MN88_9PAST|nr:Uncharacterised protein [Rodentibacter pneumotropicus]